MVAAAAVYELPVSVRLSSSCLGKRFAIRVGRLAAILATPEIVWTDDRPSLIAPTSRLFDQTPITRMAESGKDAWEKSHAWGSVTEWNPQKRVAVEVRVNSVLLELKIDSKTTTYSEYLHGRGHPQGPQVDTL